MPTREFYIKKYSITRVEVQIVSMTTVEDDVIDIVDTESDPYNVLQRKITLAMELLDCDEAEAQRFVLTNCK